MTYKVTITVEISTPLTTDPAWLRDRLVNEAQDLACRTVGEVNRIESKVEEIP